MSDRVIFMRQQFWRKMDMVKQNRRKFECLLYSNPSDPVCKRSESHVWMAPA